jgi:hypothetical protein
MVVDWTRVADALAASTLDRALAIGRRCRLAVVVGALGGALVFASLLLPWFSVPETFQDPPHVFAREPLATLFFKALCAAALVAGVAWIRRLALPRHVAARAAAILLGVLLLYPHAVMVWCPVTAGEAAWLHAQHESLVWKGGDLWTSDELRASEWKNRVYVADMLEGTTVVPTPAFSPRAIPFDQLQDLLDWLGYSNSFCFFARAGWGLAIGGCTLLLFALCRGARSPDFRCLAAASRAGGMFVLVTTAICLASAGLCALQLDRSRRAAERGDLALSLHRLEVAAKLVPALRENTDFAEQVGMLQFKLGMQTPEASLYRAAALESRGQFEEAEAMFAAMVGKDRSAATPTREAIRALLRRGVRQLNSGQPLVAAQTLRSVLDADPCNVKANYALELAYLRTGRFEQVSDLAVRMQAVYRYFNTTDKLPVLGAVGEDIAYAAYLRGDAAAAHAAWKRLGDPKRLRSGP